ncbi:MAG: hypothetical protein ACKOAY_05885, partial [Haliscomenobacter sp.]
ARSSPVLQTIYLSDFQTHALKGWHSTPTRYSIAIHLRCSSGPELLYSAAYPTLLGLFGYFWRKDDYSLPFILIFKLPISL